MRRYQSFFDAAIKRRDSLPATSSKRTTTKQQALKYARLLDSTGYFRDPYSPTSVLWALGLSWWRDVLPLLNDQHELLGANLRKFRHQVSIAEQGLPAKVYLETFPSGVDESTENSPEAWHQHFTCRRKQLLAFLDTAIKYEVPILCSL